MGLPCLRPEPPAYVALVNAIRADLSSLEALINETEHRGHMQVNVLSPLLNPTNSRICTAIKNTKQKHLTPSVFSMYSFRWLVFVSPSAGGCRSEWS